MIDRVDEVGRRSGVEIIVWNVNFFFHMDEEFHAFCSTRKLFTVLITVRYSIPSWDILPVYTLIF
jgi:hypothetical protein